MITLVAFYLAGVGAALGGCLACDMDWKEAFKMAALSWVSFGFLVCDLIGDIKH
jgi:hypothetical protein